jgi:iron complex transport system permease protein
VVVALATALAAALFVAATALGDIPLSPAEVLATLAGGGDDFNRIVILELRLPRVATALLVGAALGIAGALTQTIARNPLASPDILGVTAGASAAAVAVIVLGGGTATGLLAWVGVPLAAMAGALLAAAAVYLLAWRQGTDGFRLVLVGIGINELLLAVVSWLLIGATILDAEQALRWITGSLNGRGWEHVLPVAVCLLVAAPALVVLARWLRPLQLGDDTATALGVSVQRSQAMLLLLAVALTATATAAAGPIAFVAFVAPQIAVRLVRGTAPPLLTSALVGAAIILGSDVISRVLLPVELPVGIVTTVLGAPYLVFLLIRQARRVSA